MLEFGVSGVVVDRGGRGSASSGGDIELGAGGVEKIERRTFTTVLLPNRRPRGAYPLGGLVEPGLLDTERDVRILGQREGSCRLVEGRTKPQIAGEEVGALAPSRQWLRTQRLHVKAERTIDVPYRECYVIETADHIADCTVRRSNARKKVATAPSTAPPIPSSSASASSRRRWRSCISPRPSETNCSPSCRPPPTTRLPHAL